MESSKKLPILTIILAVLLAAAVVVILVLCLGNDKTDFSKSNDTEVIGGGEPIPEEQNKQKDTGSTHLPSYGELTFDAETKKQSVVLRNPGENSCLLCISLILPDGREIYRSELVEPGYYTRPIELASPMERGIYKDVTLKYECFTNNKEKTPLNGATTKLDIIVQ